MKQWMATIVLLAASTAAAAQSSNTVRKQAESSLLINGSIVIEPDGRTASVAIEQPELLPKSVVDFVTANVQKWTFKPVVQDGKPIRTKAPMTVRVVAKKAQGDNLTIQIRSASFGDDAPASMVSSISMSPPRYPVSAIRSGVTGTVFLVLRIDRSGKVIDVVAEQTNLRVAAREQEMAAFRKTLERASMDAAKKWTYAPPRAGDDVNASSWTVRVPVSYALSDTANVKPSAYGTWQSYIPGPRNPIPWLAKDDLVAAAAGGADAVSDGRLQQIGLGPQLLTPLGPG